MDFYIEKKTKSRYEYLDRAVRDSFDVVLIIFNIVEVFYMFLKLFLCDYPTPNIKYLTKYFDVYFFLCYRLKLHVQ